MENGSQTLEKINKENKEKNLSYINVLFIRVVNAKGSW